MALVSRERLAFNLLHAISGGGETINLMYQGYPETIYKKGNPAAQEHRLNNVQRLTGFGKFFF